MATDTIRRARGDFAGRAKKLSMDGNAGSAGHLVHVEGRAKQLLRPSATGRVKHFVRGSHRLAITSRSLAELLGLMEAECRMALDAMAARGHLRKELQDPHPPLYCKE